MQLSSLHRSHAVVKFKELPGIRHRHQLFYALFKGGFWPESPMLTKKLFLFEHKKVFEFLVA